MKTFPEWSINKLTVLFKQIEETPQVQILGLVGNSLFREFETNLETISSEDEYHSNKIEVDLLTVLELSREMMEYLFPFLLI